MVDLPRGSSTVVVGGDDVKIAVKDKVRQLRPKEDALNQFDLDLIGPPVRVEVAFTDVYKLRADCNAIIGYFQEALHLTYRTDLTQRQILGLAKQAVSLAKLASSTKTGKPRRTVLSPDPQEVD